MTTNFMKALIGLITWNIGVISYAALAHNAPTGLYWEDGYASAFEIAFTIMTWVYLIGVPIITGVWIVEGKEEDNP